MGRRRDVAARVRVAVDPPAAFRRLIDQHPRSIHERRVAGGGGDDVGQLPDDAELLLAVEDADRRQDLHADVVAVAVHVGDRLGRHVVDERRGVAPEQREVRDLLPLHHRGGEVPRERVRVGERPFGGVHIDHRHGSLLLVSGSSGRIRAGARRWNGHPRLVERQPGPWLHPRPWPPITRVTRPERGRVPRRAAGRRRRDGRHRRRHGCRAPAPGRGAGGGRRSRPSGCCSPPTGAMPRTRCSSASGWRPASPGST